MAGSHLRARILAILGYTAFFFTCFVAFAYWSFPYDRLRDYAVQQMQAREAEKRGARDRYELQIGELEPAFMFGLAATDVKVIKHPAGTDEPPVALAFDAIELHPSLLSLVMSSMEVDVAVRAGGGTLEGHWTTDPEHVEVGLELSQLDLKQLGLGPYLGLPLTGRATGTVDVSLPADAAQSTGTVRLAVEALTLGDGEAKLKVPGMRSGFTIEKLDAGKLVFEVDIQEGAARLSRFETDGKDLVLDGSGSVRLASPFARSRLNLTLELKFSEDYKERDEKTKALFELMSFRPELKRATTPTGSLRFQVGGTAGAPQGRPAGKGAKATRPTKRVPKRPRKK